MIEHSFIKVRLFWKILLWFWLSFVLVFILNLFILQQNDETFRFQKTPKHLLEQVVLAKERVERYLSKPANRNRLNHPKHENVYIVGPQGQDLLGKDLTEAILSLHKQTLENDYPTSLMSKDKIVFGGVEYILDGIRYKVYLSRVVSYLSADYMASFFLEFAYTILASMFLVSFPLSFLLAWWVVNPIKKLRSASTDISKDIRNKKKLHALLDRNDEFAELAKDLEAMRQQIEEQLSARTRLISDVSHELRSPLTRMQIAIGIANQNISTNKKEFERIKLEADRMNLMLTELLDYTKLDTYQRKLEDIDLERLLLALVDDARFEAEQVGVTITSELQSGLIIQGNRLELLSCLENIIRNAIRYATKTILFKCSESGPEIVIEICDDGKGVPEADVEKIFDAFYRPDLARSRQSGGVGLGLAIAKKAIDSHGGRITAQNIKPHGFLIKIIIPRN